MVILNKACRVQYSVVTQLGTSISMSGTVGIKSNVSSIHAVHMIGDSTSRIYCTISPKSISQFWSCNQAVAYVFHHKAEPSSATGTIQYLLD